MLKSLNHSLIVTRNDTGYKKKYSCELNRVSGQILVTIRRPPNDKHHRAAASDTAYKPGAKSAAPVHALVRPDCLFLQFP